MKISEVFEGENSSLRKAFDVATTPDTMRGRETEIREAWMKETWITEYHDRKDIADWWLALRAKELGEIRERIRNMPKRNLGTNQYEEKYVRWNSFGKEQGVDDFLDELIEKPQ